MANMMNSSTSLVSEMIGQDDQASAVVFASFNIIESFSVGGVAMVIMAGGLTNHKSSLSFTMGWVPIFCAMGAYTISYFRYRKATAQFYGL